ncbi:MAG: hypothetical protein AABZ39_14800 [Spirochaetota bacterium]
MGNIQKGVFSRFTRSFVLLIVIVYVWYFLSGFLTEMAAPGLSNAFEKALDMLPSIAFGSVISMFGLFPHVLIFSLYAAFIHIDDTSLGNLSPDSVFIFRISQSVIGIAAFAVVVYTLFNLLFISVFTDMERAGQLSAEYANYRRLSSWIVNDNAKRANRELNAIDKEMSVSDTASVDDARLSTIIAMLAAALEQDPENIAVQRSKMKAYTLRAVNDRRKRPQYRNSNRRIRQAVEAAANGRQREAETILENVLAVDPGNNEARFQLADVQARIQKVKFPFEGRSADDIHLVNTLSNAMQAYGMSNYWRAYEVITNLCDRYPLDPDVRKYRALTLTAINRDDFTIEDARHVERFVVHHTNLAAYNSEKVRKAVSGHLNFRGFAVTNINGYDITDGRNIAMLTNIRGIKITSVNGILSTDTNSFAALKPFVDELASISREITFALNASLFPRDVWLSLPGGRMLRIASIIPFEDKQYAFGVTELIPVRGVTTQRSYAYARIFDAASTNRGPSMRLLLKGERTAGAVRIDDRRTAEMIIPIPQSILPHLDTSRQRLQYLSLPTLYQLYQSAREVGYAVDDIAYVIGKKTITPFWIVALMFIMTWASLAFRVSYPRRMHPFHRFIGGIGVVLFAVIGMTFFDIAFNALYNIISLEVSIAAIAFAVIVIVAAVSFLVARYRFSTDE